MFLNVLPENTIFPCDLKRRKMEKRSFDIWKERKIQEEIREREGLSTNRSMA